MDIEQHSKRWAETSSCNDIDVNLGKPETIPAWGTTRQGLFLLALRVSISPSWDEHLPFHKAGLNLCSLEAGSISAWPSVLKHLCVLLITSKCPGNNSKANTLIWRHIHRKLSNKSTLQLCVFGKKLKKAFFKPTAGFELFYFIKGYL